MHSHGVIRSKSLADIPLSTRAKQAIHQGVAWLLSLQQPGLLLQPVSSDSLEDRAETWDYLGEGQIYSEPEKESYYSKLYDKLMNPEEFSKLREQLFHSDLNIIYTALEKLKDLMGLMTVFSSLTDRQKVAHFILTLFSHVVGDELIQRVASLVYIDSEPKVQLEVLRILTFFAPGPRIPDITEDSYLHPSHKYTKKLLMEIGCMQKVVAACESGCIEVRDQALLTIGFFSRHDAEYRDYMKSLGIHQTLLRILAGGTDLKTSNTSTLIRALWVVSIFCGATMPAEHSLPHFSAQDLAEITNTIFTLLELYTEDEILATNGLISLSYSMPFLAMDQYNKWALEKLISHIGNSSTLVKRAAFQALRNIIWTNSTQCQLLTELGLFGQLTQIFMGTGDTHLKLDICNILRYFIQKGYGWEIVGVSALTHHLQYIICSDPDIRWEALRIIHLIVNSNSKFVVEDMVNSGMVRAIFHCLISFREVSPVIAQIYGVNCVTYNFGLLHECFVILDKIFTLGWRLGDHSTINSFASQFNEEEAVKVLDVVKIIAEEVKKGGHDLYQLNHGEINVNTK